MNKSSQDPRKRETTNNLFLGLGIAFLIIAVLNGDTNQSAEPKAELIEIPNPAVNLLSSDPAEIEAEINRLVAINEPETYMQAAKLMRRLNQLKGAA